MTQLPIQNTDQESLESGDKLLARYYAACHAEEAERVAGMLLEDARRDARRMFQGSQVCGHELEDLCQQTVLSLLAALRRSREPGAVRILHVGAYTRQVVRNLLIDRHHSRKAQPALASLETLLACPDRSPEGVLPPAFDDVEAQVVAREIATQQIWPLVCGLPPLQRAAFALGLEADALLYLAGTVSRAADGLGMPLADLFPLWRQLPLSDHAIAERLGIAEQGRTSARTRVSNLRKSARETLWRRLRAAGL